MIEFLGDWHRRYEGIGVTNRHKHVYRQTDKQIDRQTDRQTVGFIFLFDSGRQYSFAQLKCTELQC